MEGDGRSSDLLDGRRGSFGGFGLMLGVWDGAIGVIIFRSTLVPIEQNDSVASPSTSTRVAIEHKSQNHVISANLIQHVDASVRQSRLHQILMSPRRWFLTELTPVP